MCSNLGRMFQVRYFYGIYHHLVLGIIGWLIRKVYVILSILNSNMEKRIVFILIRCFLKAERFEELIWLFYDIYEFFCCKFFTLSWDYLKNVDVMVDTPAEFGSLQILFIMFRIHHMNIPDPSRYTYIVHGGDLGWKP